MNLTFGTGDHHPLVRVSVCLLNRPVGGNHLCQEIDIPEKNILFGVQVLIKLCGGGWGWVTVVVVKPSLAMAGFESSDSSLSGMG